MEIQSISASVVFQYLKQNNRILLRKVNFAFMIPNPSLHCSYVVLNFWPNLSLVLTNIVLVKACTVATNCINKNVAHLHFSGLRAGLHG